MSRLGADHQGSVNDSLNSKNIYRTFLTTFWDLQLRSIARLNDLPRMANPEEDHQGCVSD